MDSDQINLTPEEQGNQALWNEIAPVHYHAYDMEAIAAGKSTLDRIQIKELGDLHGKSLLHVQCHIGNDTLSLARLGASVSGSDFSETSLKLAQDLFDKAGMPADFYRSNTLDIAENIPGQYDVVYTTQGVLCWIRDLNRWAQNIAAKLKPGGFLYLMEIHPFCGMLDVEKPGFPALPFSYFHKDAPTVWAPDLPDYADKSYRSVHSSYEWQWTISDILNSLIQSGLQIEFFNEYPFTFYSMHPDLVKDEEGFWQPPESWPALPLSFTLKARKAE